MHVDLASHSQLAAACRSSCPRGRNCRDCPLANLCVRFEGDAPVLALVSSDDSSQWSTIRPTVRVENLTRPDEAA